MTQYEIAISLNMSPQSLSRLFNGHRRVGSKTAKRIAAYLGYEDWRRFVEMPGHELRALLKAKATTKSQEKSTMVSLNPP